MKEDIERRTGHRTWVQAIVVFWSNFPDGRVDDGQCIFIHGPQLRAWMQSLPNRLDLLKAEEIANAITHIANHEPSGNNADGARAAPVPSAD